MKKIGLLLVLLGNCCAALGLNSGDQQWTWLHRKEFTPEQQMANTQKKELISTKINLPAFTQLVFSWNAFRPTAGHFTFYAQVRNAKTKKWSKWHKMASWGHNMQTSFKSQADKTSSYHHVRLESPINVQADAFSIKIEALSPADLGLVKSFAVNLSNLAHFKPETELIAANLASVYIKGVPSISQFELNHARNDGLCSPTSCTMLMSYLLASSIDPLDFAEKSLDHGLDKYGSWPFNIAHAFERSDGKISMAVSRFNSFKNLYAHLCKGIPVVVSVRGHLEGAPRVYHNGHLLVVVGYDAKAKQVICHDPAVSHAHLAKKKYQLKDFLNAWEKSHRLAYLAERIV